MVDDDPTTRRGPGADRPPGLRVVLIDDNLDAADLLAQSLGLLGHETWVANDGAAGLELLRSIRPDAAVVDLGLPILDGYEVAERARAEPALAALRLIALTGYGGDDERQRTRAAGFDAHLVKPVTVDQLDRALRARG